MKIQFFKMGAVVLFLGIALSATAQTTDTTAIQTPPDYFDSDRAKLDIALQLYDSIMHGDLKEYPFGFVFKDGKAGIYDFRNLELLTEIIYESLFYTDIQEGESDTYHMFRWETEEEQGMISISESSGEVMSVGYKKEEEDAD